MLPIGTAKASALPEDVVAGKGGRAVLLPWAAVPADRDDRNPAAIHDGVVAPPRVKGTVAGHGAYLFISRDLVQQIWQHLAVAFAA